MEPLPSQRLAQLQAIYDGAPVGLAFVDADLRYVSINQRLANLSAVAVEDHLGRKVSEIVPAAAYSKIEPYLFRALKGEAIKDVEITKHMPEGKALVTHLVSHQPVRDEAGEVVGVSIAVVDITERKRTEDALRASEDHYRHMVELNSQMLWIMEPDGMLSEASRNWTEFSGLSSEQTLNSGWRAALHPDDLEQILPVIHTSLQSGDPIDVQYRARTADSSFRWMRSRAKPLRNANGEISRWYGSTEDIDDHIKLKNALREAEAKLAALTPKLEA